MIHGLKAPRRRYSNLTEELAARAGAGRISVIPPHALLVPGWAGYQVCLLVAAALVFGFAAGALAAIIADW